jgi:hypothetical protein
VRLLLLLRLLVRPPRLLRLLMQLQLLLLVMVGVPLGWAA